MSRPPVYILRYFSQCEISANYHAEQLAIPARMPNHYFISASLSR